MSIKILYKREGVSSTLLTLSATAIALLLMLSSPALLPLSNPLLLLQPAQAQATLTFRTPIPANGTYYTGQDASITFDAQGEKFLRATTLEATGTYQITDSNSGQILSSGSIFRVQGCCLSNPSNGDRITILSAGPAASIEILTSCSTSASNNILVQDPLSTNEIGSFSGPVECSSSQGGGNTTTADATMQPSSSMTTGTATTAQDSDGDGKPDSSDKCPHNSVHRCFKEGDASTTTTTKQQQPSSSSSGTENQTGQ
jgi:hypothetical protein